MLGQREKEKGLAEGSLAIAVLVETPLGVLNAYPLARASDRVAALLFGSEDFLVTLQGREDDNQMVLHTPRAQIAIAARAAGVEAIDTPYVQVHDLGGLQAHALRARDLGMSGMLVMSPRQIPMAHSIYTPSAQEVQEAEDTVQMLEKARRAGRSYSIVDGKLVAPSREKRARTILARAAAIQAVEAQASTLGPRKNP
jgi:citrate lyase subunit beta/citryl-CoA lyase